MPSVTELELPLLAIEHPDLAVDPTPFVEVSRRQHPWLARSNVGGYIVHGYHAVRDILYMDRNLRPNADGIVAAYGADPDLPWSHFMTEMMLSRHGPEHTRVRGSVASAFTPRNVNRYRGLMRQVISDLLDEWAPKGSFDFVEFASNFPITVFCGVLGITTEAIPSLREAFETQAASHSLNRELLSALLAGYEVVWKFADELIVARERSGGTGGLLDELIAAKNAGKLNDTELRHMFIVLIIGAYDTSKNMLSLILHSMLRQLDLWERCAEDRPYCDKVVEEGFRHSGVSTVYRLVTQEFSYEDVTFPKGTVLLFMLGLAGRDPTVFASPLEFNPEPTQAARHVTFGRGVHMCIGQHLARAQLEEGVHLIAQRLTKPRLAGEVLWRPYIGIWGIRSLPIEFDPAPARGPGATETDAKTPERGCPVHQA